MSRDQYCTKCWADGCSYCYECYEKARLKERRRIFRMIKEEQYKLSCADEILHKGKMIAPWTPEGCAVMNHNEDIIKKIKEDVKG